MKSAIITGSTGLVGMAVARHLSMQGISILCLGRENFSPEDAGMRFGKGSNYLSLEMREIPSLADRIDLISWSPGTECVFYNFAWRGQEKLTDGSFGDQIENAVHAAEAVRLAKKIGCIKFVNVGTTEEAFVEQCLVTNNERFYQSAQTDYALAKLASRDICKMVAYLEKIDYVHTRLSVPLALDLSRGGYVAKTMKIISDGKPYENPKNKQLFDIIFVDDVARAYGLIGLSGKNMADYFIGTSRPATLAQYFNRFEHFIKSGDSDYADLEAVAEIGVFDTQTLYHDTGFVASTRVQDIIKNLMKS